MTRKKDKKETRNSWKKENKDKRNSFPGHTRLQGEEKSKKDSEKDLKKGKNKDKKESW